MRRKIIRIFPVILCLVCSGCWDLNELNDRTHPIALGMETTAEGKVRVTLQLPNVDEAFAHLPMGGQLPEKPFRTISSTAESSFNTVPGLIAKTSRTLFYGQLKVIVLSRRLAEQGIAPFLDFVDAHPEIPSQALIVLTRQPVEELLSKPLASKRLPALDIMTFLQLPGKTDHAYTMRAWQLMPAIEHKGRDAFLTFVDYHEEEKTFSIKGLGVFNGDRLVGELSDNETRMYGLLSGKARNAYLSVPLREYGRVSFRGVKSHSKIKVREENGILNFDINLDIKGFLIENVNRKRFSRREIVNIQRWTAEALNEEMTMTLRRLQELNSDLLSLGELLRASRPEIWKRVDWKREYPHISINISVKFDIDREGTKD